MSKVRFEYKIYLEADDISQSRILSTTSFVEKSFKNSGNSFLEKVNVTNENDLDEFMLRVYLNDCLEEETDEEKEVDMIAPLLAEILSEIAQVQSYVDMEGSFCVSYNGRTESYEFASESGNAYCDFKEILI